MLDIGRWNYETHSYDPYTPEPEWKVVLYTQDMSEQINCTNCGKDMTYGEGYTSKELHNSLGLGYPVCDECHSEEIQRDRESRGDS